MACSSGCACSQAAQAGLERRVLIVLLAINAVMFVLEGAAGWLAESTGLLADALDMLADAGVYGIALYAVGRAARLKTRAARISGGLQIGLAGLVAFEVLRRALYGAEPLSLAMIGVGLLALIANLACVALLARHRDGEVHMRASWIFSVNDALANLGVILAGVLVWASGSHWPDLIIGGFIVTLVLRGGLTILAEARRAAA